MVDEAAWKALSTELDQQSVTLVAVSKLKPKEDIARLYELGQRDFGENYVQELIDKQAALPEDIRWHFIGHLQSNKVKYLAPFVHLIHAVDSYKLLLEIDKQAAKNRRVINVLLQLYIATEESKFGMDEDELNECLKQYKANETSFSHIRICGLMGMASFSEDQDKVREEFRKLRQTFDKLKEDHFPTDPEFSICSMGMSGDYRIAVEEGSTMVRAGSMLFGSR